MLVEVARLRWRMARYPGLRSKGFYERKNGRRLGFDGAHFLIALFVVVGLCVGWRFFGVIDLMSLFPLCATTLLGVSFHLYVTEALYLRSE